MPPHPPDSFDVLGWIRILLTFTRKTGNILIAKTFYLIVCISSRVILEQAKSKPSKPKPPANAPACKDLEKQALEMELQKQEKQEQEQDDEQKKTWKEWFKCPNFYMVSALSFYLVVRVNGVRVNGVNEAEIPLVSTMF